MESPQVTTLSFEETMSKLEEITKLLESGKMGLSDAVNIYLEGMTLKQSAVKQLNEAKLKLVVAGETQEYNELRECITNGAEDLLEMLIDSAKKRDRENGKQLISEYAMTITSKFCDLFKEVK